MFLICHVASREHVFKRLYDINCGNASMVSDNLTMFGYHWSSAKKDITYLVHHKIKQDYETEK